MKPDKVFNKIIILLYLYQYEFEHNIKEYMKFDEQSLNIFVLPAKTDINKQFFRIIKACHKKLQQLLHKYYMYVSECTQYITFKQTQQPIPQQLKKFDTLSFKQYIYTTRNLFREIQTEFLKIFNNVDKTIVLLPNYIDQLKHILKNCKETNSLSSSFNNAINLLPLYILCYNYAQEVDNNRQKIKKIISQYK